MVLLFLLFITNRSVDYQVYTAFCSVARDESATYVAWGHSLIVSPWYVNA